MLVVKDSHFVKLLEGLDGKRLRRPGKEIYYGITLLFVR
jgi:hypothetical protein